MGVNELGSVRAPGRLVPSGTAFRYQGGALTGRQVQDPKLLAFPFADLIGEPLAVGRERRRTPLKPTPLKPIRVEQSLGRTPETGCRQR